MSVIFADEVATMDGLHFKDECRQVSPDVFHPPKEVGSSSDDYHTHHTLGSIRQHRIYLNDKKVGNGYAMWTDSKGDLYTISGNPSGPTGVQIHLWHSLDGKFKVKTRKEIVKLQKDMAKLITENPERDDMRGRFITLIQGDHGESDGEDPPRGDPPREEEVFNEDEETSIREKFNKVRERVVMKKKMEKEMKEMKEEMRKMEDELKKVRSELDKEKEKNRIYEQELMELMDQL